MPPPNIRNLPAPAQAKCARSVVMANMRAWLHTHAMVGKVDKLHPAVEGMIEKVRTTMPTTLAACALVGV